MSQESPKGSWEENAKIIQNRFYKNLECSVWHDIERGNRNQLVQLIKGAWKGTEVPRKIVSDTSPEWIANCCELIYKQIRDATDFEVTVECFYHRKSWQNHVNRNLPLLMVKSTQGHSFFLDMFCDVHKILSLSDLDLAGSRSFTFKVLKRGKLMAWMKHALFGNGKLFNSKALEISIAEENEKIVMMCDKIYDHLNLYPKLYVAISYVTGHTNEKYFYYPVINFKSLIKPNASTIDTQSFFVLDHAGHVYKSWELFQKENKYPKCNLCYPYNGFYECDEKGDLCLKFISSQACRNGNKLMIAVKTTASLLPVAALCFGPITGTILSIAAPALSIIESTCKLINRYMRELSISLSDPTGYECWVSILKNLALCGSAGLDMAIKTGLGKKLGRYILEGLNLGGKFISQEELLKFCLSIFKVVKKKSTTLWDEALKMCGKMKNYLVELYNSYFRRTQPSIETTVNCISETSNSSEGLAQKISPATEDEFLSLAHFVTLCETHVLKKVHEFYWGFRSKLKDISEDSLSEFDKEYGITIVCDRDTALLKIAQEIMSERTIEIEQHYHNTLRNVPECNNDGDLKFKTDAEAVNVFFRNVIEMDFGFDPSQYFKILREVTTKDNLVIEKEAHDRGSLVKYYDKHYPVLVVVYECERERFLKECNFNDV